MVFDIAVKETVAEVAETFVAPSIAVTIPELSNNRNALETVPVMLEQVHVNALTPSGFTTFIFF